MGGGGTENLYKQIENIDGGAIVEEAKIKSYTPWDKNKRRAKETESI